MKKLYLSFILLFTIFNVIAQTTTTVCSGDSIKITLNGYISGSIITWQQSTDSTSWFNIPGATSNTLATKVNNIQYYRALVKEPPAACSTYVSTVTKINTISWNAGLTVSKIDSQTVGSYTFPSSSKLKISWLAPVSYVVDHYRLTAIDDIKGDTVIQDVSVSQNSDTLEMLKSATAYSISIRACGNSSCSNYIPCKNNVTDSTSNEYWQLQGTGNTVSGVTKLISDANVLSYGFVYGSWYASKEGLIRYYYNPTTGNEKGLKPAISNNIQDGSMSAAMNFTANNGYGITKFYYTAGSQVPKHIGQACAIPYNGKIRMFFEALNGNDNKNRIYYLDSKDGYEGIDFDSSSSTLCDSAADYATGGGCEYFIALGIQTDPNPSVNVSDVRQFKIGYPTIDNWLWKGDNNTFMAVTYNIDTTVSCGNIRQFTTGYAVYDSINGNWTLQYSNASCPYFWDGMQAPAIIHMGGNRYKLYFNDNQILKGQSHNPQTDTKPMKVVYATASSGNFPSFSDWETVAQSRDLIYLWPDGTMMTESEESKLDDHHFFSPTYDINFLVQYTNVSDGTSFPFIGTAKLLNP